MEGKKIFHRRAKIISHKKIAPFHYKMTLEEKNIAKYSSPGQFIQIKISEENNPLLRRPFSINNINFSCIDIIYKIVGKGTKILSQKKIGEYLDILGPLGQGFKIPKESYKIILVGGGYGISPLYFLGKELKNKNFDFKVIISAKNKALLICKNDFKKIGVKTYLTTENGSIGKKGLATDLLKNLLNHSDKFLVYACGPISMLKCVVEICKEYLAECQVSLETIIACGLGACFGCTINTKDGYKLVCKDGPVFRGEDIIFDEESKS